MTRARAELKAAQAERSMASCVEAVEAAFSASARLHRSRNRLLKVPDDTLGELLPGVIGRVLAHQPAQQSPAQRDREANRESKLVAEAAVIHRRFVLVMF
jgi:hypothetical protein